jgi:hypothetical protein
MASISVHSTHDNTGLASVAEHDVCVHCRAIARWLVAYNHTSATNIHTEEKVWSVKLIFHRVQMDTHAVDGQ